MRLVQWVGCDEEGRRTARRGQVVEREGPRGVGAGRSMPVVTPATGGVSHNSGYGGVCVVKHGRALVFAMSLNSRRRGRLILENAHQSFDNIPSLVVWCI